MKNIWIMNQYVWNPDLGKNGRHFQFAKLLSNNYNVKIITGSYLPGYDTNIVKPVRFSKTEKCESIKFKYIRNIKYRGNGIKRYIAMFEYMSKSFLSNILIRKINKPQYIISSSVHPLTWISGYLLSRIHKSYFIVETRDLWPKTLIDMNTIKDNGIIAKLMYRLEKFMYNKANHLIFTMPGGAEYCQRYKIPVDRISYINNGINIQEFDLNIEINKYKTIEILKNNFNVFYTGTISYYNGVNYLIESAKIISELGIKDIHIYIVGDGLLLNQCKKFVIENKLSNVTFLGRIHKKYIPYLLSKSDLNALLGIKVDLNRYGLSPNKLFDYFASGKPIISNRITKYDLVKKFDAGITVDDENPNALVNGILRIYNMKQNSRERYNEISFNSRTASSEFEFSKMVKKIENIFERNTI